jgi:Pirin C-terminal cupin domain
MGFAISGMHYSATQSAIFTAHADAVQLVSGKPIEEPVAWYGPRDEYAGGLQQAVNDLRNGTFIKAANAIAGAGYRSDGPRVRHHRRPHAS